MERLDMTDEDLRIILARIEERMIASEKALRISSDENHRRLEILNGEAGRLREMQASYVPRETYDRGLNAIEKATKVMSDEMDRRLKVLETTAANMAGKTWVGGAIVLVLAAVIAAVIPMVMK